MPFTSIFLETTCQGTILLEDTAEFLEGGGADTAQLAGGQQRLEQVRGVHDATRRRAGPDHGMDLVNEQDGVVVA